ncbi:MULTISPECIES: isochorismatase family protein [Ensifer]|jgi:nicotinamidase-related amidase|uniref:Isochorismatase family protein n=1 Tax=Ensifer canadensis TaxID=555315 RepID=A0AAW4FLY0_9HYPH|nr:MULTISPECIES: isochorismatase family protein [Ensifer]MDP9632231.1 nicotinamidase-related amidase [Ensifer adhaerens]KQU74124.1 isochorismatase [Ensifer sp. Root31]KQW59043.1 isochorismatase [Ensifer sp. Root1252]KQW62549.1 isochorismatase [Ensifer sp. Root127]KQY79157.1 isochorismatase [Ensifer sp. Root142]
MSENGIKLAEALVVVDVQRAFISGADAVPDLLSLQRAVGRLLERAREKAVPIIFVQNDGEKGAPDEPGTDGWQLFFDASPGETVVRKSVDDGFHDTDLEARLRSHRVETIAICGMLSEMCLAATARRAMDLGFQVILAHDAHATYDVPPGPGGSEKVPAHMAARAAEWSLGDEIVLVGTIDEIGFEPAMAQAG